MALVQVCVHHQLCGIQQVTFNKTINSNNSSRVAAPTLKHATKKLHKARTRLKEQ